MSRTRAFLVPVVLVATGAWTCLFSGCGKQDEAVSVDPSSPKSYMNDKAFLGKLAEQKKQRQLVMKRHYEARQAYVEALKADPKGERPETQELKRKMDALEDEHRALRQETMKTVRERITPKKGN